MCGRYSNRLSWREIWELYNLSNEPMEIEPRSNIAPTQSALVIRRDQEGRKFASMMRWGLIPSWAPDPKKLPMMVNAKAETITKLPSFRTAVRKRRAVSASCGWIEWTGEKGSKQPWRIVPRGNDPALSFAAIWESWTPKADNVEAWGKDPIESFAIITTTPSADIAHIHDRMPVVLSPSDVDLWLDPDPAQFDRQLALLKPAPVGTLRYFPGSSRVNSARNEGPELIDPIILPAA